MLIFYITLVFLVTDIWNQYLKINASFLNYICKNTHGTPPPSNSDTHILSRFCSCLISSYWLIHFSLSHSLSLSFSLCFCFSLSCTVLFLSQYRKETVTMYNKIYFATSKLLRTMHMIMYAFKMVSKSLKANNYFNYMEVILPSSFNFCSKNLLSNSPSSRATSSSLLQSWL